MVIEFSEQHEASPRVDIDLIVTRMTADNKQGVPDKKEALQRHYGDLLHQYTEMELTLPVEDEPMKRICQVLTDRGFITQDSCEGHGRKLPHIFFTCENQQLLRDLAHVLIRASQFKRFPWEARIWSADTHLNPDSPLNFILSPSQEREIIDPEKDREELLRDLDIIGICLMDHFNTLYETGTY